ncbi:metallophosphoesterase family protein [Catellatospora coxensis]|uniref:Metallophosphoesterase n=1 Tax=Catellatospora coxensis TaxID=310354 RepID=A0A8J3KWV2_9ACTN|nr:metallophosphoesterase [Catellatospora coxensis]GIG04869.1 metallophosphoesterase [Catellatospora coxensis]
MHSGTLYAISDLHVGYAENRALLDGLRPTSPQDWLIVAGDVGEMFDDVLAVLAGLRERFAKVIWAPGNHELWTPRQDPVQTRGEHRYLDLVRRCRQLDVLTPEDDYAIWEGAGGPVAVAPLFVLYDYSFRMPGMLTKAMALQHAYDTGIVCADEMLLHPDPYASREDWCRARVEHTRARLDAVDPALPTILVNHFPLVRQPTDVLWHPQFAQWCGTELTADWHVRYRAAAAVYGHLHIPRLTWYDGVPFQEVSLGYPREWKARSAPPAMLRPVQWAGVPA